MLLNTRQSSRRPRISEKAYWGISVSCQGMNEFGSFGARCSSIGVLEYWSVGFRIHHSTTPSLRYCNLLVRAAFDLRRPADGFQCFFSQLDVYNVLVTGFFLGRGVAVFDGI